MNRLLITLVALVACGSARADIILLRADLTIGQEVGANTPATGVPLTAGVGAVDPNAPRPASFGTATFTADTAVPSLFMTATIFNIDVTGLQTPGINDDLVAAHIHASAPPGATAGVRWGFFGAPDNDLINEVVLTPFLSGVGGVFSGTWDAGEGNGTTLAAQLPDILAGLSYINFHTAQFRSGEIRGQLFAVPEPGSIALLGLALGAFALSRRRKNK